MDARDDILGILVELRDAIRVKPDVMFGTVATAAGDTLAVVIDGDSGTTPVHSATDASADDRVVVVARGTILVAVATLR